MPTFSYQARDSKGKKVRGELDAASEKALADRLNQDGYLVNSIRPAKNTVVFPGGLSWLGGSISKNDLAMFYFQAGNMLEAGVSLLAVLRTIVAQAESARFRKIINTFLARIEGGESLSEAMSRFPKEFPALNRSIIQMGETSGGLGQVLRYVGEMEEARAELVHKVQSSLAYPVILILSSIAVVIFMMIWIVPSFTMIFDKAGVPLPLPTHVLHEGSEWLRVNGWFLAAATGAVALLIRLSLTVSFIRYQWDRAWLSLPVIGLLIKRIEVARWARGVSLMLASGVPILRSLEASQSLAQNALVSQAVNHTHRGVQAGGKLADTLGINGAFPSDVVQMVATGESSGTLDKMLVKVASFYDQLVVRSLKQLTDSIEPVFVLFMGGVVGFIMVSILLPIFDMIRLFSAK